MNKYEKSIKKDKRSSPLFLEVHYIKPEEEAEYEILLFITKYTAFNIDSKVLNKYQPYIRWFEFSKDKGYISDYAYGFEKLSKDNYKFHVIVKNKYPDFNMETIFDLIYEDDEEGLKEYILKFKNKYGDGK